MLLDRRARVGDEVDAATPVGTVRVRGLCPTWTRSSRDGAGRALTRRRDAFVTHARRARSWRRSSRTCRRRAGVAGRRPRARAVAADDETTPAAAGRGPGAAGRGALPGASPHHMMLPPDGVVVVRDGATRPGPRSGARSEPVTGRRDRLVLEQGQRYGRVARPARRSLTRAQREVRAGGPGTLGVDLGRVERRDQELLVDETRPFFEGGLDRLALGDQAGVATVDEGQ